MRLAVGNCCCLSRREKLNADSLSQKIADHEQMVKVARGTDHYNTDQFFVL